MTLQRTEPEDFARALRERFNLPSVVDLADLAQQIGLEIRDVDADGFEGALVRAANKPIGIVAVRRDLREPGRRRFTIAHELGHFVLPGHGGSNSVCKSDDIETLRTGAPAQEIDANRFSAELLLPADELRPIVKREYASTALAKKIAAQFQTSLTAAAQKCVSLSDKPDALVMTIHGKISWYKPGPEFPYHIAVGERLSPESAASNLSTNNREEARSVPAGTWIPILRESENAQLWEDSIYLPYYDSVLTVISQTETF